MGWGWGSGWTAWRMCQLFWAAGRKRQLWAGSSGGSQTAVQRCRPGVGISGPRVCAACPGLVLPFLCFVPSLVRASVGWGQTEKEKRGSQGRGSRGPAGVGRVPTGLAWGSRVGSCSGVC